MKADYLVCCGDLGDKAVPQATERAWKEVIEIQNLLNAKRILATVGNHDVDSRHKYNDHDAKGVLLGLVPGFPFAEEVLNCQFWTHHFAVFEDPGTKVRFTVMNSSGYHGEATNEYEHGRVSARTLERLKRQLTKPEAPPLNVLVCHHHPQKHNDFKLGDYDDMKGGPELLTLLSAPEFGPWLVLHGHKHHPKISYAQGGNCSPVIFSAGSCAAILGPDLQGHARNQAYLLEVTVPTTAVTTCNGRFRSWDWAPGRDWQESQSGSGLPACGGFGFRGDVAVLADQIETEFPTGGKWKEIVKKVQSLQTLLPSDGSALYGFLKKKGFNIEPGKDQTPVLIEK